MLFNLPYRLVLILVFVSYFSNANASNIIFSGTLETKFNSGKNFDNVKSSDIIQTIVEIGIKTEINESVAGNIVLLYKDDGRLNNGAIIVDEAFTVIGNPLRSALSIKIGRQVVPFGLYETNMISDPLTLQIGETTDTSIIFGYEDQFNFSFYVFNGDINEVSEDNSVATMGLNIGYTHESDDFLIDIGVGYINNIGDSNRLGNLIDINIAGNPSNIQKFVPGIAPHLLVKIGNINFVAEAVFATEDFNSNEIRTDPAKPSAINIELGLEVSADIAIGIAAQQTIDLDDSDLKYPEKRSSFALSYGIADGTSFGFELTKDKDYITKTGNSATNVILHFAAEF